MWELMVEDLKRWTARSNSVLVLVTEVVRGKTMVSNRSERMTGLHPRLRNG